jgi:hypothetical protein
LVEEIKMNSYWSSNIKRYEEYYIHFIDASHKSGTLLKQIRAMVGFGQRKLIKKKILINGV